MPLDDDCACECVTLPGPCIEGLVAAAAASAGPVFTTDWFSGNIGNWQRWLAPFVGKPVRALEVGSWEGRSALWLLEHVLTHADARIDCVDTWEGGEEHTGDQVAGTFDRFLANMTPYSHKVRVHRGTSAKVLRRLAPTTKFDLIYIDGSHKGTDVLTDAVLSWPTLKEGGVLIFDDFGGAMDKPEYQRPSTAICAFMHVFQDEIEVISAGYQMAIRRVAPGTERF